MIRMEKQLDFSSNINSIKIIIDTKQNGYYISNKKKWNTKKKCYFRKKTFKKYIINFFPLQQIQYDILIWSTLICLNFSRTT